MAIKIITENRKARHDYHIIESFEAGIQLMGSELKPIRAGQVQLKDSHVEFLNNEMFLLNVHISTHAASSYNNHLPDRKRKLLMHRHEISKLYSKVREKGYTIIPTKMYFKNGHVKVEVAFVKGKKQYDKRDAIKKRDQKRDLASQLKKRAR